MHRHVLSIPLLVLALSGGAVADAWPQVMELASRGPRFIAAWKPSGEAVDVSSAAVFRRRVSLDLTNVTADEALKEITRQADLEISYSKAMLPSTRSMSLHAREITVAAALTEVLLDAGVDVAVARGGHMALVKRRAGAPAEVRAADSGGVSGRVTDKTTEAPIVGATVVIERTQRIATTDSDGLYHIADVPGGTYDIRARYIGYAPLAISVTVPVGADATADFALVKSVQVLDEVVTTGTAVPTEVKALPTPITIVSASDIEQRRPQTLAQLLRQFVPGAISSQDRSHPVLTYTTTRGASSLNGPSGLKVYIDGVEAADRLAAGVDPASIERVEVIRGPQAGALYGSDAIGGVMQIFTKRGTGSAERDRPSVEAEAVAGSVQSPYEGSGALHQEYRGSIRGGSAPATYHFGGSYTRVGDWYPGYSAETPSVFGSLSLHQGALAASLSGRYFMQLWDYAEDPRVATTGLPVPTPSYVRSGQRVETVAANLSYTTPRWRHVATFGIDRYFDDQRQTRRRLMFPGDTLLFFSLSDKRKVSVAYNVSVSMPLGPSVGTTVTAGVDHYTFNSEVSASLDAVTTTGTIRTVTPIEPTLDRVTNTGLFAQALVAIQDRLFLTGSVRREDNSAFGDHLGRPIAPRAGVAAVHQVGATAFKWRASYGDGIRPPSPDLRVPQQSQFLVVLGNPLLGPERQRGGDVGLDIVFGGRASLSATYYNQVARDLIQLAIVDAATSPITFQNINVGRVKNEGLELEASASVGGVRVRDLLPDNGAKR